MKGPPKLMVVDDEIDVCNFLKSFFELRGFTVCTALNGDDALLVLAKEKPDVVLLDVKMRTETEGLDYLTTIKKALPLAKVIMVTGIDDTETVELAKSLGADDYIVKPLVLEYLESTVIKKIGALTKASYE